MEVVHQVEISHHLLFYQKVLMKFSVKAELIFSLDEA